MPQDQELHQLPHSAAAAAAQVSDCHSNYNSDSISSSSTAHSAVSGSGSNTGGWTDLRKISMSDVDSGSGTSTINSSSFNGHDCNDHNSSTTPTLWHSCSSLVDLPNLFNQTNTNLDQLPQLPPWVTSQFQQQQENEQEAQQQAAALLMGYPYPPQANADCPSSASSSINNVDVDVNVNENANVGLSLDPISMNDKYIKNSSTATAIQHLHSYY
jgi:hypothetical protein